jgi:glycosyltransferase involved in cell wall biosynthesis
MEETLAVSFIDGGETRGIFTWSLAHSLIRLKNKINITHALRNSSCHIAINRSVILRTFLEDTDADWLLCIDSDIVFEPEHLELLWEVKSEERQVVSGVYFLLTDKTNVAPVPMPSIFRVDLKKHEEPESKAFYHPMPENQIVEISRAGFGFLMMSRSVVEKVLALPINSPFAERFFSPYKLVGEDFVFFEHLESLGIKSYAHTGIVVGHEKNINVGLDYYTFFHTHIEPRILRT